MDLRLELCSFQSSLRLERLVTASCDMLAWIVFGKRS